MPSREVGPPAGSFYDYAKKHTYTFASGLSIKAGATVTVYTGSGTNSATKRYWGQHVRVDLEQRPTC